MPEPSASFAWWDAVRERDIPVHPMSTLRRDGVEETVAGVLDRVWDGVSQMLYAHAKHRL